MGTPRRLLSGLVTLGLLGMAALAGTSWYYGGEDGMACARCHEIHPMVDAWGRSSHRNVGCRDCHGSSFSVEPRIHLRNLVRTWLHARGGAPEQIHVRHPDVAPLVARCASCHRQEHADWVSGPHGVTYATLFLNPTHNTSQQLMDDCLRCHGMHFEGGIRDLVAPLDRKGPWRLVRDEYAALPAIPCFACHAIHRSGEPLASRKGRGKVEASEEETLRPSLAFYDRRALEPVGVERLPLPAMREGSRPVRTSPDRRQALCYQCHAPRAGNQVFSGDDRTPVGVHEGLSCQACHAQHGETTHASCAECHPRLSNCGLDVETMDTSFHSKDSRNDIHRVSCSDCHRKGVPRKPARLVRGCPRGGRASGG